MPTSLTLPLAAHASAAQTERGLRSRGGKAPTDLLHIAGGGELGQPPNPTTFTFPGLGGRASGSRSLGHSPPPTPLGRAARAISTKGYGTGARLVPKQVS